MEKKALALTLAIVDLGLSYLSFTGQQYFSALSLLAVVLASAGTAAYLHSAYAGANLLRINSLTPVIFINNSSAYRFSLGGIQASVTGSGAANQTVSLLVVSRSPNYERYFLGPAIDPYGLSGARSFNLSYQLPVVNNSTKLFVFAFSKDYIASRRLDMQIRYG